MADNAHVSNDAGAAPRQEPEADDGSAGLPEPTFRRAGFGREGYRVDEVDTFVHRVRGGLDSNPPTMAPYEVADERFGVVRWRAGYSLRDVDHYLARAQEVLRARHGDDPVAALTGRLDDRRHVPTGWIYIAALVLAVLIVAVAVSQFR